MTSPVGSHSWVTFNRWSYCYVWKTSASSECGTSKHWYCVHNIIIYNICYCFHNIIVRLVLIQQRRDSDDARSNSRADWPELQNYRLKVEIFQLWAKIARNARNAPPGKMSRLSQSHTSVRWLFVGFSRAKKNRDTFGVNVSLSRRYSVFPLWLHYRNRDSNFYTISNKMQQNTGTLSIKAPTIEPDAIPEAMFSFLYGFEGLRSMLLNPLQTWHVSSKGVWKPRCPLQRTSAPL